MLGRFHIEHVFFHTFKTVDDRYYIEIEHDFRYYRIKHNYNTQKTEDSVMYGNTAGHYS